MCPNIAIRDCATESCLPAYGRLFSRMKGILPDLGGRVMADVSVRVEGNERDMGDDVDDARFRACTKPMRARCDEPCHRRRGHRGLHHSDSGVVWGGRRSGIRTRPRHYADCSAHDSNCVEFQDDLLYTINGVLTIFQAARNNAVARLTEVLHGAVDPDRKVPGSRKDGGGAGWWASISKEFEWLILVIVAVALGVYAFKHMPGSPPTPGISIIEAPTVSVDQPEIPSSIVWQGVDATSVELDLSFGTTAAHPVVHWAIVIPSYVPLSISKGWSGSNDRLSSLKQWGIRGYGVDKLITPSTCPPGRVVHSAVIPGSFCDNVIIGWSYLTKVSAPQISAAGPVPDIENVLSFDLTWKDPNFPISSQNGTYFSVVLPGTVAGGYGIEPSYPSQGPIATDETGAPLPVGFDTPEHLPWLPYLPAKISVSSYYYSDTASQAYLGLSSLDNYQIINGVPPQKSPNMWAWLTQGISSASAVGEDPSITLQSQQVLFWLGIALGVAGSALVNAVQAFVRLRTESHRRGVTEPFARLGAMLAGGMTVFYLWLAHQQVITYEGPLYIPAGFIAMVLTGGLLATYGAFWRVPYRRTALAAAAAVLTLSWTLALSTFLYLWFPILASNILVLVSALRRRQDASPRLKAGTPGARTPSSSA
jgi:hypothetical protein